MSNKTFPYPRKLVIRKIAKGLAGAAFWLLSDFQVSGKENLPDGGPLLVVANHFSFIDPVALVHALPYPIEYLGGAQFPHAPKIVKALPGIYGYYPLYRGTGSRYALRAGKAILDQGGVLGIFPEGGNWAEVLRPARPGAAYLASRTDAQLLPVALYGLNDIFPLKLGKRPTVHAKIGKPIGPFSTTGRGRERREQLDQISRTIMQSIADLMPDELRGFLAEDPAIREAAKGTEVYPWANAVEGEVDGEPR
jgi:1-acyl-sn-glycerol-3-phosphate acyltransferase